MSRPTNFRQAARTILSFAGSLRGPRGLVLVLGSAAIVAACSSSKDADVDARYEEALLVGEGTAGAHDFLPSNLRAQVREHLQEEQQVEAQRLRIKSAGDEVAREGGRWKCDSSMQDVNCYADACALELGGDVAKNYIPDGIDPREESVNIDGTAVSFENIKTFWNRKEIKWESLEGVWQYTFDGRAGAADWPEKGAGLTGPVTSASSLKCDFVHSSYQSCIPTQKRLEFDRAGVHWVMLFRRDAPLQPGVAATDPRSNTRWGNIALVAYKQTEAVQEVTGGQPEAQNAVCWFNTFNKTNSGQAKSFPIPVPGGRFGTTTTEQARRTRAIQFWDTPQQHRTLQVNLGEGTNQEPGNNCVQCHGNGPVLDLVWFREKKASPNDDDSIPYYSTGALHNSRTFFKFDDNRCAGSCHTYWARGTQTCDQIVAMYTTPDASDGSLRRNGWTGADPEETAASTRPEVASRPSRSLMMPDSMPSAVATVGAWETRYREDVNKIIACCRGTSTDCGTVRTAGPPAYYGEHETAPAATYRQKIPAPADTATVTASGNENCTATDGKCAVAIAWQDGDNVRTAPESYRIASGEETSAFCSAEGATAVPASAASSIGDGWRLSFRHTLQLECGKTHQVRVCGEYGSASRASRSTGTTVSVAVTCAE